MNVSNIFRLSVSHHKPSTSEGGIFQSSSLSRLISDFAVALYPIPASAATAAARTCQSSSFRALVNGSTARLSPILSRYTGSISISRFCIHEDSNPRGRLESVPIPPRAMAAAVRTCQSASCKAMINGPTICSFPVSRNAIAAAVRTCQSASSKARANGSIA